MNKKGFLRVVEATISILIIVSAVLVGVNIGIESREPSLSERARDVLREIANDDSLRTEILTSSGVPQNVIDFANSRIPALFSFEMRLCDVNEVCGQPTYNGNVFSAERIISSDLTNNNAKKLRLFIWIE
jgi:hypothetical protein